MKVEEKYELLKNGELDKQIQDEKDFSRLNELNKKFIMTKLSPEEEAEKNDLTEKLKGKDMKYLRELDGEKLAKIKNNIPKVANILEVKENLVEQIKEVKEELNRRIVLVEAEKKRKELEKEKVELDTKWRELDKKIEKSKNNPEEKDKAIKEQEALKEKYSKHEEAVNNNQKTFAENKETKKDVKNKNLKDKDEKTLAKMNYELSSKISMCNMAARGLMEGKDIGDIELDKNIKGKKFNAREELRQIVKTYREKNKESKEKNVKAAEQAQKIKGENVRGAEQEKEQEGNGELIEHYDFAKECPMWAKIPGLAKLVNFIKNRQIEKKIKAKSKIESEKEAKNEIEQNDKFNEFKEYLKDAAEKGKKQADKNRLANNVKLENAKKQAHERETEKYGKDYADKSYKIDDEER